MILTDREIRNSLASGLIEIDPAPAPDAYSPTAVDLALDPKIRIFKKIPHGVSVAIDPGLPEYDGKRPAGPVWRNQRLYVTLSTERNATA